MSTLKQKEFSFSGEGSQNDAINLENQLLFINIHVAYDPMTPFLSCYPREMKT